MADLILRIRGDSASVENALKRTDTSINKTSQSFNNIKRGAKIAAAALTGLVVVGLKKASSAAIEFEEANAKFGTVFKNNSIQANAMRKELVKSYGLSTQAATEMLAGIQDFLVPMGLARDEATALSGDVAKLARDLGSFNNQPTEEVLQAIQSALSGISMPMKRFGVDVSEAGLQTQLMNEGIDRSVRELSRAEKAQLIYRKIVADSTDAQGDFARTSDSVANTLISIKSQAQDVSLIFGQELMKSLGPLIKKFNEFLKAEEGMKIITNAARGFAIALLISKSVIVTLSNIMSMLIDEIVLGFQAAITAVSNFWKKFRSLGRANIDEWNASWEELKFKRATDMLDIANSWEDTFNEIDRILSQSNERQITGLDNIVKGNEVAANKATRNWKEHFIKVRQMAQAFSVAFEEIASGLVAIEQNKLAEIDKGETAARMKQAGKIQRLMKFDKAVKLASATIDTAAAIMKTWAAVGFPAGIPLAIAQGAAGAIQIAKIAGTPIPTMTDIAAPHGAEFVTEGPQTLTVGDNPSGRERVTVTPEEDIGMSETMIFNVENITIQANDPQSFGDQMKEFGIVTARR